MMWVTGSKSSIEATANPGRMGGGATSLTDFDRKRIKWEMWNNRANEVYFGVCLAERVIVACVTGARLVTTARTGNHEMEKVAGLVRIGMGLLLGSLAGILLGALVGAGIALLLGVI